MDEFEALQQQIPGVQQNIQLKHYTTFRIGGPARYFFVAKTNGDIVKAVQTAKNLYLNVLFLSGGSNMLVPDEGFDGLVVKIQNSKFEIRNLSVWAEAGVEISELVAETGKRGLSGLEWAGGLPGTLGGAVRGNAGAFGVEIKDTVVQVEALDEHGEQKTFSKKECQFAYRSSVFKKEGYTVLTATLELRKEDRRHIQAVATDHMQYRKERHPLEYPNAGSVFKNCDVAEVSSDIREEFRKVIKEDPFPVIPAAAFIAAAKLQGLRVGGAVVSAKHPNYIVNDNNATARDVLELIDEIKKRIKKKFGVALEEEITIL